MRPSKVGVAVSVTLFSMSFTRELRRANAYENGKSAAQEADGTRSGDEHGKGEGKVGGNGGGFDATKRRKKKGCRILKNVACTTVIQQCWHDMR